MSDAMPVVKIQYDYYSEQDKEALRQFSPAIFGEGLGELEAPLPDFLTYYSYHLRSDRDGWRDFQEMIETDFWKTTRLSLHSVFYIENGLIYSIPRAIIPNGCLENLGEATGISLANQLHGLTNADWQKIPTHGGPKGFKTFDYKRSIPTTASDGKNIIQIECKASLVDDSDSPTGLSDPVGKIRKKKVALRIPNYKYPANLAYGTVAAIPRGRQMIKCWLVDPPVPSDTEDPFVIKILARSAFYLNLLADLFPTTNFTACLANRVQALFALQNPRELNEVNLTKHDGKPLLKRSVDAFYDAGGLGSHPLTLGQERFSCTAPRQCGGDFQICGISGGLLQVVESQSFEALGYFKTSPRYITKTIPWKFKSDSHLLGQFLGLYPQIEKPETEKAETELMIPSRIIVGREGFLLARPLRQDSPRPIQIDPWLSGDEKTSS